MKPVVVYYRVSTVKQGRSGLGLEAQQHTVREYLATVEHVILESFTEVESGKNTTRAVLREAIDLCKATGATLVVAKFDRLSRNAAFLLSLQESGVKFVAADMPDVNELVVGIMALVAQQEAKAISKRTKEALAAAKARGQVLGPFSKADKSVFVGRRGTRDNAARANAARAAKFAAAAKDKVLLLERFDPAGVLSLRKLADAFNEHGIPTISGKGRWAATSIARLKSIS